MDNIILIQSVIRKHLANIYTMKYERKRMKLRGKLFNVSKKELNKIVPSLVISPEDPSKDIIAGLFVLYDESEKGYLSTDEFVDFLKNLFNFNYITINRAVQYINKYNNGCMTVSVCCNWLYRIEYFDNSLVNELINDVKCDPKINIASKYWNMYK